MRHRPVAVAQVEFLAGADAPDVGRVEALVTVDDRELTDLGQRIDVEDGAVDRNPATSSGKRPPCRSTTARAQACRLRARA